MLYYLYEMNHAALAPWRAVADAGISFWRSPANPLSTTQLGRSWAASLELFERTTRRYAKRQLTWFRRERWLTPITGETSAIEIATSAGLL